MGNRKWKTLESHLMELKQNFLNNSSWEFWINQSISSWFLIECAELWVGFLMFFLTTSQRQVKTFVHHMFLCTTYNMVLLYINIYIAVWNSVITVLVSRVVLQLSTLVLNTCGYFDTKFGDFPMESPQIQWYTASLMAPFPLHSLWGLVKSSVQYRE